MNIKQLESFVAIVDNKSFTKAAKKLFVTQPAVSFQIKALEEQVGVQLLDRVEQEVVPTEGGLILYQEAKKILACYKQIIAGVDKLKNLQEGTLKLGASTIPGEYILPHYLGEFSKSYPQIELGLKIGSSQQVVDWLKERTIDIGVIGAEVTVPGIELIPFLPDELVLIAASNSSQATQSVINVNELMEYKWISREKGSGTRIALEQLLAKHGISLDDLRVTMELGTSRAVLTAVQADLGVSFVSKWAVQEQLALGRLQQIQVEGLDLKRRLYLIVSDQHYVSVLSSKFIDFAISQPLANIFS